MDHQEAVVGPEIQPEEDPENVAHTPPLQRRGPYKKVSDSAKARIMAARRTGGDWRAIAKANGVKTPTVRAWAKKEIVDDLPVFKPKGGARHSKITEEHKNFIVDYLSRHSTTTVRQLTQALKDAHEGLEISADAVRKSMHGLTYTVKQVHFEPETANNEVNLGKRALYVQQLLQAQGNNRFIVYEDESNYNVWVSRSVGWSKK
ncbi:hypothetical protein FOZ61_010120, partial [Perkinsus olseni]